MEYFDDKKNSPGVICSRLSTDCEKIATVTGTRISTIFQNTSALVTALVIGFIFSWQMTLLLTLIIPLLGLAGYLEGRGNLDSVRNDDLEKQKKNIADSEALTEEESKNDEHAVVAFNAMNNFKTVAMLSLERKFLSEYYTSLEYSHQQDFKLAAIRGISYSFSQSMIFFAYAAAFRLGTHLIYTTDLTFSNMFKVMSAMVFGAMAIGQNQSSVPDYADAKGLTAPPN